MKNTKRDYNLEIKDNEERKYFYGFDYQVMHPYMLQAFRPFFRSGNILELGSYEGHFTGMLSEYFNNITCIEAAEDAINNAKDYLLNKKQSKKIDLSLIQSEFETVVLKEKFDNIVMTHVLEHISDPVSVLRRVNNEWLSDSGRFFLVCPNANAPSRQIAVKMGLISHNSAVTPGERDHGHHITYTLDTLERDAKLAGLKIIYRTGIFFKALANFQWDRLLETDIITKEYLDGCYQLGQQYPDLCSSIFILCEKGN